MGHDRKKSVANRKIIGIWMVPVVLVLIVFLVLWIVLGKEKTPAETLVLTVGEEAVYLDEVYFGIIKGMDNLGITKEDIKGSATGNENGAEAYYKQEILRQIMDYKVEYLVAKERGFTLTEEEQKEIRKDVTEYLGSVDARMLNKWGITKELIERVYTEWYMAHKLEQSVTENIEIEEQRFCTIYMMMFPKIEMAEDGDYVRQEDGQTPVLLTDEEIQKVKEDAKQALQELEAGADAEETAKKYGVDAYSSEDSNLAESFAEPFLQYATTLKENECSPVIETEAFFAIVKMITENNEEYAEEIMSYYRADMEAEEIETQKVKWYEQVGAGEEPEFAGRTWDKISLFDFVQ